MSINVITIGGGGGHAQVLKGLKTLPDIRITAVCPSTDSGGSTGQLVNDYKGSGYIGDLTKCIAALCPNKKLSDVLSHRFEKGVLVGHSVKNILMLGLERTLGIHEALSLFVDLADISPHRVLPVATQPTELRARLKFGNEIAGETNIDLIAKNPLWHPHTHAISDIFLKPSVRATPIVLESIEKSDWIVICPGDLYSSILPVLLPRGMRDSIKKSKARIIVFLNIMTKQGETHGYTAQDFIKQIEKHLGRKCDLVFANNTPIPKRLKIIYALEHKVTLSARALNKDSRMRSLPLLKVTPDKELYHNELEVAKALRGAFKV